MPAPPRSSKASSGGDRSTARSRSRPQTFRSSSHSATDAHIMSFYSRVIAACGLVGACAHPARAQVAGSQPRYDLVIANGTIIDGTGAPRFLGDIAISGDHMARLERGSIPSSLAKRTIDAKGLIVAPGFIDLHAHLDPLPTMPDAQSAAMQGVTLALGGPDGGGPWPFGPYLDSLDRKPLGINVAFLAGHNSIRRDVMGTANRAPTADELVRM